MAADDGPIIETLGSRVVYENPWMSVREDEVRFPNGQRGIFGVVDKADFALVVPWSGDGFWLVNQYRYAVQRREWEFPQGGWPQGESGSPVDLAAAELQQETGLRARTWTHLGFLNTAHGHASQGYDVFLAAQLTQDEPDLEDTESDLLSRWFAVDELRGMIASGEFRDAHSIAALALFDARQDR